MKPVVTCLEHIAFYMITFNVLSYNIARYYNWNYSEVDKNIEVYQLNDAVYTGQPILDSTSLKSVQISPSSRISNFLSDGNKTNYQRINLEDWLFIKNQEEIEEDKMESLYFSHNILKEVSTQYPIISKYNSPPRKLMSRNLKSKKKDNSSSSNLDNIKTYDMQSEEYINSLALTENNKISNIGQFHRNFSFKENHMWATELAKFVIGYEYELHNETEESDSITNILNLSSKICDLKVHGLPSNDHDIYNCDPMCVIIKQNPTTISPAFDQCYQSVLSKLDKYKIYLIFNNYSTTNSTSTNNSNEVDNYALVEFYKLFPDTWWQSHVSNNV